MFFTKKKRCLPALGGHGSKVNATNVFNCSVWSIAFTYELLGIYNYYRSLCGRIKVVIIKPQFANEL